MEKIIEYLVYFIIIAVVIAIALFLTPWLFMIAWNFVAPALFSGPVLSYWQSFAIIFILQLISGLFKLSVKRE